MYHGPVEVADVEDEDALTLLGFVGGGAAGVVLVVVVVGVEGNADAGEVEEVMPVLAEVAGVEVGAALSIISEGSMIAFKVNETELSLFTPIPEKIALFMYF